MKHTASTLSLALPAYDTQDAYKRKREPATFETFRDGFGSRTIEEFLGLDIDRCAGWIDFRNLVCDEFGSFEDFANAVEPKFPHGSTVQKAIALALLRSFGLYYDAAKLADQHGTNFDYLYDYTTGVARLAVDCAIAQIDSADQTPLSEIARGMFRTNGIGLPGVTVTIRDLKRLAKVMKFSVTSDGGDHYIVAPEGHVWLDNDEQGIWSRDDDFSDVANRMAVGMTPSKA